MSPATSLAGCCLAVSLLWFARADLPPPPCAAFQCPHHSRHRAYSRNLEMQYHVDPRLRRAANATDDAKYPPANGHDRGEHPRSQNVDRLRVDLLRTQLTAKTAQDRARTLEAELGEMTRNFNIVRNALREERKQQSIKSLRPQPETAPSPDVGDQRLRAGDGNRTLASGGAPTEEAQEGARPTLPPMAAALFANAEREEREKRQRRGLIEEAADALPGGEGADSGRGATAVGRTNTTVATAAVLGGDKKNATVAAAAGSNATQLPTAAAIAATNTKREQKASDCPLPVAKEAGSRRAAVVDHHGTATTTAAVAVVGEEENTALVAAGETSATRPSKAAIVVPTNIKRFVDKNSTSPNPTNETSVLNEKTPLAAAAVDTKAKRERNRSPAVDDIRGNPSCVNNTAPSPRNAPDHDNNDEQLQALRQQCAALARQREELRRRLSQTEARARTAPPAHGAAPAAAPAEPDAGRARERDAWSLERGGLELALARATAERERLAGRLERQRSARHVAGLLCGVLGDRVRARWSACRRRRPPPSPSDRMLAVGGGGTAAAPKRGTGKGGGAGLGSTARGWLRLWNVSTTGGVDRMPTISGGDGASNRQKRGAAKDSGARLGSRARHWLRRWNAGAAGGGERHDDEHREGGPDPATADRPAAAPVEGEPSPDLAPLLLVRRRRRRAGLGGARDRGAGGPAADRGAARRREEGARARRPAGPGR